MLQSNVCRYYCWPTYRTTQHVSRHPGVKTENEYPGTRRAMSVGYPGNKISTRFNPSTERSVLIAYKKVNLLYLWLELFWGQFSQVAVLSVVWPSKRTLVG